MARRSGSRDWYGSSTPQLLFSSYDLRATLDNARAAAKDAVESYPADDLLSQPESDIAEYLAASRFSDAPVLHRDQVAVADHGEARIDVSHRFDYAAFDRSSPTFVPGERVEVAIPFDGDKKLFDAKPATFTTSPPYAVVLDQELRLVYEDVSLDADALRTRIDRDIDAIEKYVGWIHELSDPYDRELPGLIRAAIKDRKERLLKGRNTVAAIGLPVRRSDEPDGYSIPVDRKSVKVARPPSAGAAFTPEPLLADRDFEDALSVLRSMRNTIERLARSTRSLGEEAIRDLLLVGLNSRFEGAAGGELFNGAGKTDILIRVDDRNVFIGECKIWRGPKSCVDALDQLLSYTVWRDSKAALLLFVRDQDVTEIIDKATQLLADHRRCKRRLNDSGSETPEFVFSAEGDEQREIRLALLTFVIPKRKSS